MPHHHWAYYNEFDREKAAWLRELMRRGLIADGFVDERSVCDVKGEDVADFTQCHWFAGIGIWSYALRLAGWGDARAIWTASIPCQPWSVAGKGKGASDSRHLWPVFARLVEACRPGIVIGEQVASADVIGLVGGKAPKGRESVWIDDVLADLERARYTTGAVIASACGFGAPHIRQRLYWAARLADAERIERQWGRASGASGQPGAVERTERLRDAGGLADNRGARLEKRGSEPGDAGRERATAERDCGTGGVEHDASNGRQQRRPEPDGGSAAGGCGAVRVGDGEGIGRRRRANDDDRGRRECSSVDPGPVNGVGESHGEPGERLGGALCGTQAPSNRAGFTDGRLGDGHSHAGPTNGFWAGSDWVLTRPQRLGDPPSLRPVEPAAQCVPDGTSTGLGRVRHPGFPLVEGAEARVLRLKGYGDGIVAQQAAEFIRAFSEEIDETENESE